MKPIPRSISPSRAALAVAQRLCRQAYDQIGVAQTANEWDMKGHAQKAKELLVQVNDELRQAAEAANGHGHQ
jgi:hypothetical protein